MADYGMRPRQTITENPEILVIKVTKIATLGGKDHWFD